MRKYVAAVVLVALVCVVLSDVAAAEEQADDPWEAWEGWGETKENKEREKSKPRRQRGVQIKPGKKINVDALMGSVPRKMMLFFVNGNFGDEVNCNALVTRWREQMRIGGVDANIGCVAQEGTIVGRAESQRDAYNAKDFLLRNSEVKSVKIEHQELTEPQNNFGSNSDLDDDEEDDL
eukprot:Plantae.Rhodophyta-Purpureofilum_apyrenoidigerum.ctg69130.p1 GENE.Plantae.Rhodophyta-Purpureofilum_apyrenoidigerum.ctg69130~~Plantae.Rhodophyta-Purpureofilum_apyrenoidigerum.ctg69130.p1  ORF type:complete len:190 (+),score=45.52 Plantae.Rhodophyta-Purpureofilum_apyrenoidigerum.ctg69130:38-571(+)